MSNKQKNKRVGVGQKPRGGFQQPAKVSADAVQPEPLKDAVSEAESTPETPHVPAAKEAEFQNLDPIAEMAENGASVPSGDSLEELLEKSKDEPETIHIEKGIFAGAAITFGEQGQGQNPETGCISNEELAAREMPQFGFTGFKELPDVEFTKEGFVDPPQMRGPVIGERPDGTYGLVITIPEGMIEPIRQQAESDRVTPEEWVSTRLLEYIESWWQPAQTR